MLLYRTGAGCQGRRVARLPATPRGAWARACGRRPRLTAAQSKEGRVASSSPGVIRKHKGPRNVVSRGPLPGKPMAPHQALELCVPRCFGRGAVAYGGGASVRQPLLTGMDTSGPDLEGEFAENASQRDADRFSLSSALWAVPRGGKNPKSRRDASVATPAAPKANEKE